MYVYNILILFFTYTGKVQQHILRKQVIPSVHPPPSASQISTTTTTEGTTTPTSGSTSTINPPTGSPVMPITREAYLDLIRLVAPAALASAQGRPVFEPIMTATLMENGLDSSCLARFASLIKDRMGVRVPMGVIFTFSVERLYQYIRERCVDTATTGPVPTAATIAPTSTATAVTEGKESESSTQEVVDLEAELQHYLSYLNLDTAPAALPHPAPPTGLATSPPPTVTTSTAAGGSKKKVLLTGVTGHLGVFILRHLLSYSAAVVGEVYVLVRGSVDRLTQALAANRLDASLAADKRVHVLIGKIINYTYILYFLLYICCIAATTYHNTIVNYFH